MPVAVHQLAKMVTQEMYDAVEAKLGAHDDPPEGMLVHTAGPAQGGGFRIVDVWESREAYQRFREGRLLPAIREVAGEEAVAGSPESEVYELHDFMTP
jgi:hypothetical protein